VSEEEGWERRLNTWLETCISEQSDEQMFGVTIEDLNFLSQINCNFSFLPPFNLDNTICKNKETLRLMMELYRIVSSESYSNALKEAYLKVPLEQRVLKYEGSIFSSHIIPSELAIRDEVHRIMRFLTNTNFGKIARYMVVLAKLYWFRTNHQPSGSGLQRA